MQIQVNTDNNIEGSTQLTEMVEGVISNTLSRFGDRITRVEVYLSDQNSDKKIGDSDKRCVLEARLAGLQPISVREFGATIEQAIDGASEKLIHTLERHLGRLEDKKGRVSFSGDQMFTGDESAGEESDETV